MKKLLVLLVVVSMAFGSFAAFAAWEVPDLSGYVRQDYRDFSQYPLSDGSEKVSVVVQRSDTYGVDAESTWWWTWIQQVTGIDFEVEQVLESARTDRKAIMFASADLPDIVWNMGLTTDELVLYGQTEGMLMPLNEYINADVMPNLTKVVDFDPSIYAAITCPDGNIYTMPGIRAMPHGESDRIFIDSALLEQAGRELPTTLEEFIDTMYAFKELDPELIPLGGSNKDYNPTYYIMNAVGYLTGSGNKGHQVALRNGEAVIPAYDEAFLEVLRVMNRFYDDGIISKDFYTIDGTTVNAQMAENKLGVYPFVPFVVNADPEFFGHYESVTPLISDLNETRQWKSINAITVGGYVLSAQTEKAELICRFTDFLYSPLGFNLSWMGPLAESDYTLGMSGGWYVDPDTGSQVFIDVENGVYANSSEYAQKVGAGQYETVGNNGLWPDLPDYDMNQLREWFQGVPVNEPFFDLTQPDPFFRASMFTAISPYETPGYPTTIYMEQDDVIALQDLQSVLEPYMEAEIAKFVTGARDLAEYDAFQEELRGMGMDDYANYYKTNYENYLAKMG